MSKSQWAFEFAQPAKGWLTMIQLNLKMPSLFSHHQVLEN
jgi:hypothetical protein